MLDLHHGFTARYSTMEETELSTETEEGVGARSKGERRKKAVSMVRPLEYNGHG
jgi:hypothetical protein